MADAVKDASSLYEVERRAQYGARPGFRITELQISPTQKVPWHYHSNVQDTFYVIEGALQIFLQNPKEDVHLARGQTFSVPPGAPSPRHQCRRHIGCVSRSAGHRRIRFRTADVRRSGRAAGRLASAPPLADLVNAIPFSACHGVMSFGGLRFR
ncbi:cupin domain-containing protein [Bradyrhizobium sp. STM 3562]|uniref:cupin domain-containing protein n=1 Tax=Bradyrhizobium sp. STM 3562 TaxID=578924 RepID=UPI0038900579